MVKKTAKKYKIAIVKIKPLHEIEWYLPKALTKPLRFAGFNSFDKNNKKAFMPQMTPYYIAAIVREYAKKNKVDIEIEVIDSKYENIHPSKNYDLVMFTLLTPTALSIYKLADKYRELGVPVVLGGIHVTMMPNEAKEHADSIVLGEAESEVPSVLDDFISGKLKPVYERRPGVSLENLPVPAWDLGYGKYSDWVLPVQTSRGCGNACTYCSTTAHQGAKRRHRPIENIIDELRTLMKSGYLKKGVVVFFTDNNTVADTNYHLQMFDTTYSKQLFKALIEFKKNEFPNFKWVGQGEINMADDAELLTLMARSGCITMLIGYESLSQNNMQKHSKAGNSVARYEKQTEIIHSYGINIIGCFIFGLPGDGYDSFENTRKFIAKNIDIPQISVYTPYPGTKVYRDAKKNGTLLSENWDLYDITHVLIEPECIGKDGKKMSAKELEHEYGKLIKKVYSYRTLTRRSVRSARRFVKPEFRRSFGERFISVLAPNLVYKKLSEIGLKKKTSKKKD